MLATNPTTTGEATALHIADGLRTRAPDVNGHAPGVRPARRRRPRVRRRGHARPRAGRPARGVRSEPPPSGGGRWAAPAAFVVLWSAGFTFVSLGLEDSEPLTFLALRYVAVVALLVPVFAVLRPPLPRTRTSGADLVATGLILQALYFALLYGAIGLDAPAGTAALIVSLQPILVALLAPRVAGEHVDAALARPRARAGGAAEVIVARQGVESIPAGALLCTLAALAALTVGTLYENRFGAEQHPVTANLVQYAVALALVAPAAALFEDLHVDWTADLIVSLGYLVVANSLLAITLLLTMLRRGEASRVSALFFLTPPLAALIAWLVLGEDLPPAAWPGMVARRGRRRARYALQIRSAVRAMSASLRRSSSTLSALPTTDVAKPHCVPSASRSRPTTLGRLAHPRHEPLLGLAPRRLGGHQAQHHELVVGHLAQGFEPARALVVVLEQQPVRVHAAEDRRRDVVVAAGHQPARVLVALAEMEAERDLGRRVDHRVVELDPVGQEPIHRPPARLVERAPSRVDQQRVVRRVELHVAAAEPRQLAHLVDQDRRPRRP